MRQIHRLAIEHEYTVGLWLIDSPGDHPLWTQYVVYAVHLRGEVNGEPPIKHLDGATHEWLCHALNPDKRHLPTDDPIAVLSSWLQPANFGYQIRAESDGAAIDLIESALRDAPSFDTDYREWWNGRFSDGFSLVRSAFEREVVA